MERTAPATATSCRRTGSKGTRPVYRTDDAGTATDPDSDPGRAQRVRGQHSRVPTQRAEAMDTQRIEPPQPSRASPGNAVHSPEGHHPEGASEAPGSGKHSRADARFSGPAAGGIPGAGPNRIRLHRRCLRFHQVSSLCAKDLDLGAETRQCGHRHSAKAQTDRR